MAHVLYYFADEKQEALHALLKQLKSGGQIVIIHSADEGIRKIIKEFWNCLNNLQGIDPLYTLFDISDIEQVLHTENEVN